MHPTEMATTAENKTMAAARTWPKRPKIIKVQPPLPLLLMLLLLLVLLLVLVLVVPPPLPPPLLLLPLLCPRMRLVVRQWDRGCLGSSGWVGGCPTPPFVGMGCFWDSGGVSFLPTVCCSLQF